MINDDVPEQRFSELSVEYQIALEEVAHLKPQYEAAVKRYISARKALKERLDESDAKLNLY